MVNGDEHDYEDYDEERYTRPSPGMPLCGACNTPIHRGQKFAWSGKFAAHMRAEDCNNGKRQLILADIEFLKSCGIDAYA